MRISDWSSDVCSSDLVRLAVRQQVLDSRVLQLHAHNEREEGADDAGHDGEKQVKVADVLVIGRAEPSQEETRLVIVMRVRVRAVSHVSFFPYLDCAAAAEAAATVTLPLSGPLLGPLSGPLLGPLSGPLLGPLSGPLSALPLLDA